MLPRSTVVRTVVEPVEKGFHVGAEWLCLDEHLIAVNARGDRRERRGRWACNNSACSIVDAAMARTFELLRLGIPANTASEVGTRGGQRRNALARLHQKNYVTVDGLRKAILPADANRNRRRLVLGERVERSSLQPRFTTTQKAGPDNGSAEQHAERT